MIKHISITNMAKFEGTTEFEFSAIVLRKMEGGL